MHDMIYVSFKKNKHVQINLGVMLSQSSRVPNVRLSALHWVKLASLVQNSLDLWEVNQ